MIFRRDPLANPEPLVRRVYAYVAYRLGDGPDAEDVTSIVFESALRYVESYDPKRGEPIAWLLGIARRAVASALSSQADVAADLPEQAAETDLEQETLDRLSLRSGLARLGERDRDLLALRYGADLSARQIGDLLDLKPNAVDVAVHRALARLRTALEEPEPRLDDAGQAPVRNPLPDRY